MRTSLIAVLAALGFCNSAALAQDKVAEGEYQMRHVSITGSSFLKTATRWVLYSRGSNGYHLESEIQNKSEGLRVVQSEDLTDQMVPTTLGYDFYQKDQKNPIGTARCEFVDDSITCSARIEEREAARSEPFKHVGPFWLWFDNLFALDLPWLIGGGINMARLEEGEASLDTITVSGGDDAEWDFTADEEERLKMVGRENVVFGGTTIGVKHYVLENGKEPTDLWIAESGLVVKTQNGKQTEFVLANYKQYKKLIPELPVEKDQKKAAP